MRKIPVVVHKEDLCFYRNNGILVVLSLFVGGMEGPLRLIDIEPCRCEDKISAR